MGGFTVYVPNFINETVPIELKGVISTIVGTMVPFGIFVPSIFGLAIPDEPSSPEHLNSFYV
jgi:hypothetical protein